MGWRMNEEKLESLKCDWVNICLQVKQGMKRRGIKTIPLTRKWDETEREARKNRPVGADSRAV